MYLLFTTFTTVFEGEYHFGSGTAGLSYIGLGVGTVFGVILNAYASDKIMAPSSTNVKAKPERRLILMLVTAPFVPAGLLWYGWAAQAHVHWMVPILGTTVLGFGMLSASVRYLGMAVREESLSSTGLTREQLPAQIYIIDSYTAYAASALAATTFLRSLVGSLLPLAGSPLYNQLGVGWGNSLLALIAVGGCIAPLLLMKYGPFLREKFPFSG